MIGQPPLPRQRPVVQIGVRNLGPGHKPARWFAGQRAEGRPRSGARSRGARLARPGAPEVWVVGDPSVPAGRYRLRQARPLDAAPASPQDSDLQPVPVYQPVAAGDWPYAHDGHTSGQIAPARR